MSFDKTRSKRVEQEDLLDREGYIESVQFHFQQRIGRKDYAHIGAAPFTLRAEEAEQALDQAGGTNRDAMAMVLRAMNYSDQSFAEAAKDLYSVRLNLEQFSQDEMVKWFFIKLKDQIRRTKERHQAKEQYVGNREAVAA